MESASHSEQSSSAGLVRAAVGLIQGLCLYCLYLAAETGAWPATQALIFAPLVLVAAFVPILVIQALGNTRGRVLVGWAIAAAIVLIGLAIHDATRGRAEEWVPFFAWLIGGAAKDTGLFPSSILVACTAIMLFIAHSVVTSAEADRRLIASYPRHFDIAWKIAIQLALAGFFVALFWGLLTLGAALFELIGLDALRKLIQHRWFSMPATTLAAAGALHVTDVRAGLVRGIRTLLLTLMSWLLPLLTTITVVFLGSLIFTGLDPLWGTRHGASILLTVAAALILLINSAYQDGADERMPPRALRLIAIVAAVSLLPLAALAAYAIALRVGQHGWTIDRIISAAVAFVGLCYALSYSWAALTSRDWLRRIELGNFVISLITLLTILALSSPIADPARISVSSQVNRLQTGAVSPQNFDFRYLRFSGARYGRAALERLKQTEDGPEATFISRQAALALVLQHPWEGLDLAKKATDASIAANVTVYPKGRVLPEGFARQDWSSVVNFPVLMPRCLVDRTATCEAFFAQLDVDGGEELVFIEPTQLVVFARRSDNTWTLAGAMPLKTTCAGIRDGLIGGMFRTLESRWRDIEINGRRSRLARNPFSPLADCDAPSADDP
jgi:hypothetical protein